MKGECNQKLENPVDLNPLFEQIGKDNIQYVLLGEAFITNKIEEGKVNRNYGVDIINHSMGGLVTRTSENDGKRR